MRVERKFNRRHIGKSQKCSGFLLANRTIVLCSAFGSDACIFKSLFNDCMFTALLLGPLAGAGGS